MYSGRLDEGAEAVALTAFAPTWFPERDPLVERERAVVSPSDAEPVEGAEVGEIVDLGVRVKIHGEDMKVIGSGLHAVLAAELVNPEQPDAKERAQAILEGYGADAYVSAEEALACARRFRAHVEARFRPNRVLAECPLVYPGRVGASSPAGWTCCSRRPRAGLSSTTSPRRGPGRNGWKRRWRIRASFAPTPAPSMPRDGRWPGAGSTSRWEGGWFRSRRSEVYRSAEGRPPTVLLLQLFQSASVLGSDSGESPVVGQKVTDEVALETTISGGPIPWRDDWRYLKNIKQQT